jgi:hypothetical protein
MKVFLLVLIGILAGSNAFGDQLKNDNELKEKCHKLSDQFYKDYFKDKKGVVYSYNKNHYSNKLNSCFMYVEERYKVAEVKSRLDVNRLINLDDKKLIGALTYYPNTIKIEECYVADRKCKSINEFNNLIKPYMEK